MGSAAIEVPIIQVPVTEVTSTNVPIRQGTLRVNIGTFPDTLDPQKAYLTNDFGHLEKIYEGLTNLNSHLEVVPAAAESWGYNSDATQLTFRLRDGLKYSDGSILNAERFAYSIKRTIDLSTAAEYAYILGDISGAPEWSGGDASAESTVDQSVKATHSDGS